MFLQIPTTQKIYELISFILPIIALAFLVVFLSQVIGWFTRDKVIKLFNTNHVAVLMKDQDKDGINEAYFGTLSVPPNSGGGFEIFFEINGIINPERLLTYLKKSYEDTGDKKYLEKAEKLLKTFKQKKMIKENTSLNQITENPFTKPSQASKKVRPEDIKDIYAIIRFTEKLSEKEREERKKDLIKAFHPPLHKTIQRKTYNALGYVKDKISQTLTLATSTITTYLPTDMKKKVEEYQKEAVSKMGTHYDPLLENSIGRLVTIQVEDVDGITNLYQGVLREYSPNYIAIYNVDYRIKETAAYKEKQILDGYPKEKLDFKGWKLNEKPHIKIVQVTKGENIVMKIKNTSEKPIHITKIRVGGKEEKIEKTLKEKQETTIQIREGQGKGETETQIEYEITKKADIIWPRAKARVTGLSEPLENTISKIIP